MRQPAMRRAIANRCCQQPAPSSTQRMGRGRWLSLGVVVTTFLVMSDTTLPLAEIKKRLSEIIDGVEARHDRVVLTRNGRPAAVILSPDDLESLEETVAILSDPAAVRAIRKAEAELDRGKVVGADELRAKYLKR